ncbi:MAG: hypothetical protein HYX82_05595 [Chloroflexi bacterium]|nr:hypothetical protein [Chloroflexota bacterium]
MYYVYKIALATVARLPLRAGYWLFCRIADISFLFKKGTREVSASNIRRALAPDASNKKLRSTVLSAFRNSARNYFDLLRLSHLDPRSLNGNVTIHGEEHFREALGRGKGVILATAHLGNMDLVAQVLAPKSSESVKLTVLTEPLRPEPLYRLVTELRERNGLIFTTANVEGLKRAIRALKRGEVVALASDRAIQGTGLNLPFMGEETVMPVGAVELALRTGAALVPAFSVRGNGGRYAIYVEPPLSLPSRDRPDALSKGTRDLISVMERYIHEFPEQWVVFNPVWNGRGRRK